MLRAVHPTGELSPARTDPTTVAERYLELLKRSLTKVDSSTERIRDHVPIRRLNRAALRLLGPFLRRRRLRLVRTYRLDPRIYEIGFGGQPDAISMIGLRRMENIQQLAADVLRRGVPGDFIETGVWRGGATIFMRGILEAYGDTERRVWVADSFEGLPKPDLERYPADEHVWMLKDGEWLDQLAVSLEEVKANFERYGLLDDRVRFLVGWFKDTLPSAPIDRISLLRLDGDLYASTIQALDALYPKVSDGGYVIVDDYGSWEPCFKAVNDYRATHGIEDEIVWIDWTGAYWQKRSGPAA